MKALRRTLIVAAALLSATIASAYQQDRPNTGSISGQITVEGKPVAGIVVVLNPVEQGVPRGPIIMGQDQKPFAKSTTDEDGRFTIRGLAAGTYQISTASPVFVSDSDAMNWQRGKQINLAEGENINDLRIPLVRGGIITGRVTDSQGRPLTGQRVNIYKLNENGHSRGVFLPNTTLIEIDDRGIYRAFGLPPGRYRVSVGVEMRGGTVRGGFSPALYERTFHPDATDEARATIVEVLPGSESTSIDIKVGKPAKTFTVSGRVVYADSGAPVEGAICGYGALMPDGKNIGGYSYSSRSDKTGAFILQGLLPGKYGSFSIIEGENDYYSEPVPFEITGEDISGIEIRLLRGATISGVVVVEGTDDPEVLARIAKLQVWALPKEGYRMTLNAAKIASNGSFLASGIKPGRVSLSINSYPPQKGFQLIRVERDGVEQTEGIEITDGAQISGVRMIIAYGTARIRGQVKFESGRMPEGERLMVATHNLGASTPQGRSAVEVDQRGRFEIAGLVAGEYELHIYSIKLSTGQGGNLTKQTVIVTDNADIEVTITVDAKNEKERR